MEKTLLVIVPGKNSDHRNCPFYILIAETGECLASHFCSDSRFAYGDLYFDREERIIKWKERFGELDVKFIDETDISEEELIKRNKEWRKSVEEK